MSYIGECNTNWVTTAKRLWKCDMKKQYTVLLLISFSSMRTGLFYTVSWCFFPTTPLLIESSVVFAARPRYLTKSGEWVTVRWRYIEDPSDNDWIGVFTPPIDDVYPIDPSEHSPIKWKVQCTVTYIFRNHIPAVFENGHPAMHAYLSSLFAFINKNP